MLDLPRTQEQQVQIRSTAAHPALAATNGELHIHAHRPTFVTLVGRSDDTDNVLRDNCVDDGVTLLTATKTLSLHVVMLLRLCNW